MKILLATDAFPPVCGGSGWSTYELARGLRARGHEVAIVQPRPGTARGVTRDHLRRVPRASSSARRPRPVPYVRNYFKNEKLYARARRRILPDLLARERIDIVHAQHVMTTVPAIAAARRSAMPVGLHGARLLAGLLLVGPDSHRGRPGALPGLLGAMMTRCVRPHARALWPLALPMIPYMRANLAGKQRARARRTRSSR